MKGVVCTHRAKEALQVQEPGNQKVPNTLRKAKHTKPPTLRKRLKFRRYPYSILKQPYLNNYLSTLYQWQCR